MFILNQERQLAKLKHISEKLKGHKITEHCYEGEVQSRTDNDGSKSELTNNLQPSLDHSPFRGTNMKSINSKGEFTPDHGQAICKGGRESIMSAARSENHIIEQSF